MSNRILLGKRWSSRKAGRVLAAISGIMAYAATTGAVPMIDFHIPVPSSGLLIYDGAGGPLTGAGIQIASITGTDTANPGTYDCIGCFLDFESENFTAGDSDAWLFSDENPDSFLLISGDIDTDGNGTGDLPLLMLGDFIGSQLSIDLFSLGMFDFGIAVGAYLAEHNTEFSNFFGVPPESMGAFVLVWGGFADPPNEIFAETGQGLVRSLFQVPEPTATFLLGMALLMAVAKRRRTG